MSIHLGGRGPGHMARVRLALGPIALSISGAPPDGTVGSAYSFTPFVQGGTGPYTVTATAAPPGLAIGAGGATTGTPTQAGSYGVTYTARDATGTTAQLVVTIAIAAAPVAPASAILREDGSYLLREDGSRMLREAA